MGVGLILLDVLGFPARRTPGWLLQLGRLAPLGLVAMGVAGGALLARSSRRSARLAAVGGMAVAAWVVWLRAYLFGFEPGPSAWLGRTGPGSTALGWLTVSLCIVTAGLTLRAGGRLFRMLLGVAFGYLGLQAIRNANLFALAAGFVLAANLGDWAAELAAEFPVRNPRRAVAMAPRALVAILVGVLIVTTVSGRFYRATGERRGFGTGASPLVYAHDAARFAGRPGFPDHAWVSSLRQAGVYVFHNGPERKVFIDGRLEVPTRATFETYIQLDRLINEGRPGWDTAMRRYG